MKKIFLAICFLLMIPTFAFGDEIIDSKSNIIPCKIVTVMDGLIEYKKQGNLYTFQREKDSLIFNDYVDVREKLLRKETRRYTGKIIVKDLENVVLRNESGDINIPWYRVKFIGIYKP